jgi:hypothetical protein
MLDDIVRAIWRHIETVIKKAVITVCTDFGTLKLVPNRLQIPYTGTAGSTTGVYAANGVSADVFIIDPSYLAMTYMKGYRTEELAKTGLAENRQMSVDWSLICGTEKSHAIIGDITISAAVTA